MMLSMKPIENRKKMKLCRCSTWQKTKEKCIFSFTKNLIPPKDKAQLIYKQAVSIEDSSLLYTPQWAHTEKKAGSIHTAHQT